MLENYRSSREYDIGVVLYCEDTDECFEVVSCDRLELFDAVNFGITVKPIEKLK